MIKIGIIGGSGLDDPKILQNPSELSVITPYGAPSSVLTTGTIQNVPVVILARHNKDHSISPSNIPFRANIRALKDQGCTHILATTACGSLHEDIAPGHLVLLDQFIDFTRKRAVTFFDGKEVVHTPMADPFCPELRALLAQKAASLGLRCHPRGTVVTIEGPRFSTRAESHMFRSWKADVINMSTVPEVCLARELKMHYQAVAMSTDYDCWREGEESVTWEMILETMHRNANNVKRLLIAAIPAVAEKPDVCTL